MNAPQLLHRSSVRSTDVWATRRLGDRRLGDRFLDDHLGTGVGRLGDSNWPL